MPRYEFTREVSATARVFREADSEADALANIPDDAWEIPSVEDLKWSEHIELEWSDDPTIDWEE